MSNKDMPAYPVSEEETDRIDAGIKIYSGLTKLEAFTMAAMQSILMVPGSVIIKDGSVFLKDGIEDCALTIAERMLGKMERAALAELEGRNG